jgi:hypothetical protein
MARLLPPGFRCCLQRCPLEGLRCWLQKQQASYRWLGCRRLCQVLQAGTARLSRPVWMAPQTARLLARPGLTAASPGAVCVPRRQPSAALQLTAAPAVLPQGSPWQQGPARNAALLRAAALPPLQGLQVPQRRQGPAQAAHEDCWPKRLSVGGRRAQKGRCRPAPPSAPSGCSPAQSARPARPAAWHSPAAAQPWHRAPRLPLPPLPAAAAAALRRRPAVPTPPGCRRCHQPPPARQAPSPLRLPAQAGMRSPRAAGCAARRPR